jgi:hypothetical protein
MTLSPLTGDEVKGLPLNDLIQRMDDVRYHAEQERYSSELLALREKAFPFPRVADIFTVETTIRMDDQTKRRLADAAFRFLLQFDFLMVSSGITNAVVYGENYHVSLWCSPNHWMRAAVLDQYQIVASRIALECFFDLIYVADRGKRMPVRSKFKAFRKWITQKHNPYKYFVGHIIQAFEFDREHRQREVHGTSRFAQCLLRLQIPDSDERNISHQLTNVLLSVWRPFIEILDGKRPSSISVFDSCDEFATKYFESHDDPDSFDDFICNLLSERMS